MHKYLKYVGITIKDKDGHYIFNLWNPIGWALLILIALIAGVVDALMNGVRTTYNIIADTVRTAKSN